MEGGALFDPGMLGGQFLWWIGQIPDDATWRDNIQPGKYSEKDMGMGWGRRYKVRIIGVHDKSEETIPSDQLPWANVMYPVTAGSGAANAYQTPQIRQGNFVFGFWMDGPDQQVPVIMGIFGNNQQTPLGTSIGTSEDNFKGTSGYAQSQDPPPERAKVQAAEHDLTIVKPKTPEMQRESAPPPPGTKLNKLGLRSDSSITAAQHKDVQSATQAAAAAGLVGEDALKKIRDAVATGRDARIKLANSPLSDPQPGASLEAGATAPHIRGAADLIKDDLYKQMTPIIKPDGKVDASQKAIQTTLDNLSVKLRKHLRSVSEYSEAVSNKIPSMEAEIDEASTEIAKYEKISINKMMEYSLKKMNAEAAPTIAALPSSAHFQYADVLSGFTEKLMEEYLGISDGLADTVKNVLVAAINLPAKEKAAREEAKSLPPDAKPTHADVAICTSEEILGKSIALERPKIEKANNNMINNMNLFLADMSKDMAGLTGSIGNIMNQIPAIEGSITEALQFENQMPNIFPFQVPPVPALSDFYTLDDGSGAQPDSMTPSPMAIGQIASSPNQPFPNIPSIPKIPFAEPSKDQKMVDLLKNEVVDAAGDVSDALDMF